MSSGTSLLLDSHVWLWLILATPGSASESAWRQVRAHVREGRAAVSEITLWECALKTAQGKLQLGPSPRAFLEEAASASGVGVVEVDRSVLVDSALMQDAHRDPADRVIIATAMKYGMTVATADQRIIDYAQRNRLLKVLDVTAA